MTRALKLQELFDLASTNAARMFLGSPDHEVLPMWHAVTGKNENILIATPWSSDDEKDMTVKALRLMFAEKQVKRFAFVVEAWVASVKTLADVTRPSEHPDRREVLMITAEDRDGSSIMGWYYILRPEIGPPKLSPLEQKPFDATTGRMMGLLT